MDDDPGRGSDLIKGTAHYHEARNALRAWLEEAGVEGSCLRVLQVPLEEGEIASRELFRRAWPELVASGRVSIGTIHLVENALAALEAAEAAAAAAAADAPVEQEVATGGVAAPTSGGPGHSARDGPPPGLYREHESARPNARPAIDQAKLRARVSVLLETEELLESRKNTVTPERMVQLLNQTDELFEQYSQLAVLLPQPIRRARRGDEAQARPCSAPSPTSAAQTPCALKAAAAAAAAAGAAGAAHVGAAGVTTERMVPPPVPALAASRASGLASGVGASLAARAGVLASPRGSPRAAPLPPVATHRYFCDWAEAFDPEVRKPSRKPSPRAALREDELTAVLQEAHTQGWSRRQPPAASPAASPRGARAAAPARPGGGFSPRRVAGSSVGGSPRSFR